MAEEIIIDNPKKEIENLLESERFQELYDEYHHRFPGGPMYKQAMRFSRCDFQEKEDFIVEVLLKLIELPQQEDFTKKVLLKLVTLMKDIEEENE